MAKVLSTTGPYDIRQYINGSFVESTSQIKWNNINPATEEVLSVNMEASHEDVDKAVDAARAAFETFSRTGGGYRRNLLLKLADLFEQHTDELAMIDSLDTGKPVDVVKVVDVPLAVEALRFYAGYADKMFGKQLPIQNLDIMDGEKFLGFTKHEPVGVVAQIIPWNVPLITVSWKIGPAVATGCTVVMKSSEKNPLVCQAVSRLVHEAGFPPGVLNFISGFGPSVGDYLARHPGIDKISFTGSIPSGQKVMIAAAEAGLKRVSLELGGKSPLIVCADADLEKAVDTAYKGMFFNQGQVCSASSRVFVEESVYDEFIRLCVAKAKQAKLESPQSSACTQGPQVDKIQYDKILKYIELGISEGARVCVGGKKRNGDGYYIEPTVFSEVEDSMVIAKEEIFGPVLSALKFKTLDEAITRANNTRYGLGAGICTRNFPKAMAMVNRIKAGTVYVNCYHVFDAAAPFGGFKQSGFGRELGKYALQLYTEVKTVIVDIGLQ